MAQQNLDFNISAHTQGMEQIALLINRVSALEAETKRLQSANAGLASSTDAVIRNGTRYNNAMDAQSKSLRNARQGTQQLGMQINDFATSISTGASFTQAFNQQIGQVGYAMSMMGGVAGRVGAFLAGPWGAAITIGVMALEPLIAGLFRTSDALNQIRDDAKSAISSLRGLAGQSVTEKISMAQGEMSRLVTEQQRLQKLIREGGKFSFGRGQWQKELFAVNQQILTVQDAINQGNRQIAEQDARNKATDASMTTSKTQRTGGGATKAVRDVAELLSPIEKLNQKLDQGAISWAEYSRELFKISEASLKAKESLKIDADAIAEANSKLVESVSIYAQESFKTTYDQIRGYTDEMKKSFDSVGMSVNDAFKGMLTAGMSWKDGMRGIIQSVIDELWRMYVVQQIVGLVSSALGGMGLPAPTPVPGKAVGGSVSANTPYLVGERGPELFMPNSSGTIIPNKNMGSASGGGNTISVNVDARGSSDPAAVRAQVQQGILEAAPAIIAAAEQRTISSIRRPRLGGAIQ